MTESARAVINGMIKQQKELRDNGPIVLTADQLWKYSGQTEETNPNFLKYIKEEEKQAKLQQKLLIRYGKIKK